MFREMQSGCLAGKAVYKIAHSGVVEAGTALSINFPNTPDQLFLLARGSGGLYPRTSPEFHPEQMGKNFTPEHRATASPKTDRVRNQ
jgi:hypothetical protein